MEYIVSRIEIARRKKAYTTLSLSLIIGLVIASTTLDFPVSIGGYILVATILFLLGVFSFRFFHTISHMIINLTHQLLERIGNGVSEKYVLKNINRVNVKWTTNNAIREIYIWLNGGETIFITALDHFEEFKNDLFSKLGKNVTIKEIHEPIDFDHPLFYSLLGLPISFIGVFVCKSIPLLSYQNRRYGIIAFFMYLVILGMYFICTKPISRRSGNKTVLSDYLTGFLMICLAIVLLIFFSIQIQ